MKRYILTLTLGISIFFGNAQQAELLYDHLSLQDAIAKYEGKLDDDANDGESIYNLANAYRLNNESIKAEAWFAKAVKRSERTEAKFYYAQMLLMNGKPSKAKEWFTKYKLNVAGKEAQHIDNFITLCYLLESDQISDRYYEISKVMFNSKMMDFSPSYYGDELLFVSNRNESKGASNNLDAWTNEKYTDLYVVSPQSGYQVKPFSKRINSGLHEGSGTFTKDLNTLYFTRSNQIKGKSNNDKEKNIRLQIMKTTKGSKKWSKPTKLELNNNNYSFCHPALSSDNNTMIFASDQPGGYGGMDLYIVKKAGEDWGVPENMGEKINTSGNEVFPFIDNQDNLYFSSNFHAGFGGLDIFKANNVNGKWKKPSNVGLPMNSVKDDFGIITQDNFESGYFSSDRSGEDEIYTFKNKEKSMIGGAVVNCETGEIIPDADVVIYQGGNVFKNLKSDENGKFSFEVNRNTGELEAKASKTFFNTNEKCTGIQKFDPQDGEVELSLGLTSQFKENSELQLCGEVLNGDCNRTLDGVKITVINICNGEAVQITSDRDGKFIFPLVKNCKYKIKAEKGYFKTIEQTLMTDSTMTDCFDLDLLMNSTVDLGNPVQNKKIELPVIYKIKADKELEVGADLSKIIEINPIYFDLNKSFIRADAAVELNKVVAVMNQYPSMYVELGSHTDCRASKMYNSSLSDRRAKSSAKYIAKRISNPKRIYGKGYGEERLINHCECEGTQKVSCTEEQHQVNRRTEFKIIKFEAKGVKAKVNGPNSFDK
jgi:outer membrane protein OmpA-like peptidoglycan-associated protein